MTRSIQYLERQGDGRFILKELADDELPGVHVAVTIASESDGQVGLECDFCYRVMTERRKIPAVELDVGYPVLQVSQMHQKNKVEMNQWILLGRQNLEDVTGGKELALLLFVRIAEVGRNGKEL